MTRISRYPAGLTPYALLESPDAKAKYEPVLAGELYAKMLEVEIGAWCLTARGGSIRELSSPHQSRADEPRVRLESIRRELMQDEAADEERDSDSGHCGVAESACRIAEGLRLLPPCSK